MATPDIEHVLRRGVAEIIVERELRELLREGKPLRLKMGFDPSRPDLHLGYAVALRKLRQFQELGHQVILIVGDWTARIGDPSGMSATRQMLTEEQVNANAQTYMRQFFQIVDRQKTQVVFQSEWFGKFTLADVINLTSRFTVAQMLAREDFAQRYEAQRPIAVLEFLYPLLQGYDSVAIRSNVEFGGMDQKFNCLVGRDLQGMMGQRPQQVFLMPLLVGVDGRKMSQSRGNYIAFEEPPNDMYGKVMSIPDSIMMDYFELLTDVPEEELREMRLAVDEGRENPMNVKHRLAYEIVRQFHSGESAQQAREHFKSVIQERHAPPEMPTFTWSARWHLEKLLENRAALQGFTDSYGDHLSRLLKLSTPPGPAVFNSIVRTDANARIVVEQFLITAMGPGSGGVSIGAAELLVDVGLAASKAEAKRLVDQGGIYVDTYPLTTNIVAIKPATAGRPGTVIRRGSRRYVRIV
ncbi:MAG: tyrosine--tRNA ligase [Chloroflexi bacterium]|nr:tyrosine--tRNA ligase [Chloroflexota bacterium]